MKWWDTLQNLILAALTVTSVTLSGVLWFTPTVPFAGPREQLRVTNPPPRSAVADVGPAELLAPTRFILHDKGGMQWPAVPNGSLYDRTILLLQPILSRLAGANAVALLPRPRAELDEAMRRGPGLSIALPVPLALSVWAEVWEAPKVSRELGTPAVDFLYLYLGDNPAVYYAGPHGIYRGPALEQDDRQRLEMLVQGSRGTVPWHQPFPDDFVVRAEPGVSIPQRPQPASLLLLRSRRVEPAHFLAGLFRDLSVVREIEERDGAVVYTDGQNSLRIQRSGALEYVAPDAGQAARLEVLPALRLALAFVSDHGGIPPSLSVTAVKADGERIRFDFGFRGELPLLVAQPFVRVEVAGERVVYYYRAGEYPDSPLGDPFDTISALDAIYAALLETHSFAHRLQRVVLGYYPPEGSTFVMMPVWQVEFAGHPALRVDARTGRVLKSGG